MVVGRKWKNGGGLSTRNVLEQAELNEWTIVSGVDNGTFSSKLNKSKYLTEKNVVTSQSFFVKNAK